MRLTGQITVLFILASAVYLSTRLLTASSYPFQSLSDISHRVRPILRRLRKFLKKEQALVAEGSVREAQTTGSEVTPHIPSEVSDILITPNPNALQETAKEEVDCCSVVFSTAKPHSS